MFFGGSYKWRVCLYLLSTSDDVVEALLVGFRRVNLLTIVLREHGAVHPETGCPVRDPPNSFEHILLSYTVLIIARIQIWRCWQDLGKYSQVFDAGRD